MRNTIIMQPKQESGEKKARIRQPKVEHNKDERSVIERALQVSESKFRRLFETAQDGIILLDAATGQITDANPFLEKMLGYASEELIGKKLWEIGPFKDVQTSQDAFRELQKKEYIRYEDLPLEAKDGRQCNVEFVSNVYRVDGKKVIQCNIRDITKHKQAEAALQESLENYRMLVEHTTDTIFINIEGRITYINPAGLNFFGATNPEQILGRRVLDLVHPDFREIVQTRMNEMNNNRRATSLLEEKYFHLDGSSVDVEVLAIPLGDREKQIGQVILRDITERKRAEERLAQQTEELRQRNEELTRLYRASGSLIPSAPYNLHNMAQTIIETVIKEFEQSNCSLLLLNKDSKVLDRIAIAGPYTDHVSKKSLTLDGPGLVPQAIRTSQVINSPDVRSSPDYVPNWEEAQSELTVPLKIGDQVLGVIDIQSSKPAAFNADDERLMTIFAERAALALQNAQLFTQTERRIQQLNALRTIDVAITSSFKAELTLGVLLEQLISLQKIDAANVFVFDSGTQTFKFCCERGFHTQGLTHNQFKLGEGYSGRAALEQRITTIPNLAVEPNGLLRSPELSRENFVFFVCAPLISKGNIKGLLEIYHHEPLKPDREWYDFLEALAGQAAITIDYSELFENLQRSYYDLSFAYDRTLEGWANALELRDKETEGHTRRVVDLTSSLAQAVGVNEADLIQISRGVLLHDIGKMGIPDSIMHKPGPLSDDEWVIMKKHPQYAYDMLSHIPYLQPALAIPYCHHEKWDGTGYPRGLKGDSIPIAARIFAVLDVWDALTSDRPYRKAWSREKALEYIRQQAGLHFDPMVVNTFLDRSFRKSVD